MPRASAEPRLRRLLALVPWVAAHDGPSIDDVCRRFDCTEQELMADLDLLWVCGVYPYTPDTLIEVDVTGGRVWIRYADYFQRPLRLTPAEGLALVAAGSALLSVPGSDPSGPLARALAKLATVLDVGQDDVVDVDLGPVAPEVLDTLQRASDRGRQVEIEYYSFGRDRWTTRTIDPWRVFSTGGEWYVSAWCHLAVGERLFRVDRIRRASESDEPFATQPPPDLPLQPPTFSPRAEDPLVVLDLAPSAHWVRHQYPNEGAEEQPDGTVRVRLRVSERAWLQRLLLRLGPDVTIVEGDVACAREAAERILGRYRGQ